LAKGYIWRLHASKDKPSILHVKIKERKEKRGSRGMGGDAPQKRTKRRARAKGEKDATNKDAKYSKRSLSQFDSQLDVI
jgi:hypothetical protein